jgi:predicted chitinase
VTTTDGPGGVADAAELFTVDQLAQISQNQDPVAFDLAGDRAALVPEMIKGGIVTKNQIAAFLANITVETDHLNTLEEYGGYEYWQYLVHMSGDPNAWMYHGRGYIQLTWEDNYRTAGQGIGVGERLVNEPQLLATDKELAAKTAVWYWTSRDCGTYADLEDFEAACSLINRGEVRPTGPINHWAERFAAYERAQKVLGTGTEPVIEPAKERSEPVVVSATTWTWPEESNPPGWIGDFSYIDTHPTRYNWRSDVEAVARYLVDNYDVWVNTYVDHPPGWGADERSLDVWASGGRGYTIDPAVGQAAFDDIFNNGKEPWINWVIWWGSMWSIGGGWEGAPPGPPDSDPGHYGHVHITFV